MTRAASRTKVALRMPGLGRLGRKIKLPTAPATPAASVGRTAPVAAPKPRNTMRNLGIAGGVGAAGIGAGAYGGHQYLQGEGGQQFLYNQAWGNLDPQERTNRAMDYLEAERSGEDQGYFARQVGDKTRDRIRSEATRHMMDSGIGNILGMEKGENTTGSMLRSNWQQYLPLLLGAGLGVGGIAGRNPLMGILGLLAGGYGLKGIYDKGQELQKQAPELMLMASGRTGSPLEQQAAKKRLRELYTATAPAYRLMGRLGMQPNIGGTRKTAGAMTHLMDHFRTSEMIDEIRKDHGVDSRTGAEMITAIRNAQRIDSQAPSMLSVGQFARGAAGTALGFTLGAGLGSLMSLRPALKSKIRRVGQGLFSGADKLGVL